VKLITLLLHLKLNWYILLYARNAFLLSYWLSDEALQLRFTANIVSYVSKGLRPPRRMGQNSEGPALRLVSPEQQMTASKSVTYAASTLVKKIISPVFGVESCHRNSLMPSLHGHCPYIGRTNNDSIYCSTYDSIISSNGENDQYVEHH